MSASAASGRLRLKIDLAYPALHQSCERLWRSPEVRDLYPMYLMTMHGITRSATPLMEAALSQARVLASEDEVAAGLVPYLVKHAPEEAGHERWIVEDLDALGADGDEVLRRMPSAAVANLVGSQYYWIRHHHPVALLGHIAVMEGHPPRPGFAQRLCDLTGLPPDAFRAIRRHEELDAGHSQELDDMIDDLPLRPHHESVMGVSALHTIQAGAAVFDEIYAHLATDDRSRSADASPSGAARQTSRGGATSHHRPVVGAQHRS